MFDLESFQSFSDQIKARTLQRCKTPDSGSKNEIEAKTSKHLYSEINQDNYNWHKDFIRKHRGKISN